MTRWCWPPAAPNRVLPMFPPGQKGIHYLRTEAEARALTADLAAARSLVVIGGGVVGLEIAASAAELGREVAVIEIAPRILSRRLRRRDGRADSRSAPWA